MKKIIAGLAGLLLIASPASAVYTNNADGVAYAKDGNLIKLDSGNITVSGTVSGSDATEANEYVTLGQVGGGGVSTNTLNALYLYDTNQTQKAGIDAAIAGAGHIDAGEGDDRWLYETGTTNYTLINAAIAGAVVGGGDFTNTVLRISDAGWNWYSDFRSACDELENDNVIVVYGGNYTQADVSVNSEQSFGGASGVSIIGLGRPTVYISITDITASRTGLQANESSDLYVSGMNFIVDNSSGLVSNNNRYAAYVGCDNALWEDCLFALISGDYDGTDDSGNEVGNKTVVGTAGTTNTVLKNCVIMTVANGSADTYHVANHDAGSYNSLSFQNCVFVNEGTLTDWGKPEIATGDGDLYQNCYATELYSSAVYDIAEKGTMGLISYRHSYAMLPESLKAIYTGANAVLDEGIIEPGYVGLRNDVYVLDNNAQTVEGVCSAIWTNMPKNNWTGTVHIVDGFDTGLLNPGPQTFVNVTADFIADGRATFNYNGGYPIYLTYCQNSDFTFRDVTILSKGSFNNYGIFLRYSTNSIVRADNCRFEFTENNTRSAPVVGANNVNSYTEMYGGQIYTTSNEVYSTGGYFYDVLVYTNGVSDGVADSWLNSLER